MNIQERLKRLELLEGKRNSGSVLLTFSDGTTRRMQAAGTIPLLCSPHPGNIVDISGSGGTDNGLMVELLRGLIEE